MKILILGGKGMLGHKLVQQLKDKFDVFVTVRNSLTELEKFGFYELPNVFEKIDILDQESIRKIIEEIKPEVIINCVGIIKQLPVSKDVINTLSINSILPHQLAQLSSNYGFRLINISTDCVFKGTKGNYTEQDEADAADLYGKSKNLGEVLQENCLTIRTSIIGRELETEHSLVDWFLSNRGKKVKGFVNAIYTGFPTIILTDIIANLILNQPELQGLYHISSEPINKYDLLHLINEAYDANIEIELFEDFKLDRSLNSDKFRNETGFKPLTWEQMIKIMADDPTPYNIWK
ncbi:MAG TPA: SDR family oxidoreductase [Pyrinomonadaceae bacterium]|nr:SDR family oxidoreductase [Pyrinomonadaceae bacterium]